MVSHYGKVCGMECGSQAFLLRSDCGSKPACLPSLLRPAALCSQKRDIHIKRSESQSRENHQKPYIRTKVTGRPENQSIVEEGGKQAKHYTELFTWQLYM